MKLDKRELQRTFDRFEVPEPALERLLWRRNRRERRRRIEAGVVALTVVAVTIGLIGRSLLMADRGPAPASPATCAAGSWEDPSRADVSGAVFAAVATSDTETFVVIQEGSGSGSGHELLLQSRHGWSTVPAPVAWPYSIAAPFVASGTAPSPLWLLGNDTLWVRRSGAWSELPALPLSQGERAHAVSVTSPDDVWVAAGSVMLHFDGTSWNRTDLPSTDSASRVLAIGSDDVWAGGRREGASPAEAFTAHWDGRSWTDVPVPQLADSSITTLVASAGDVWATAETAVSGGHPTTHVLHLASGVWKDTETLQGDSYRFHLLAGGASGIWRYDWTTPHGQPTTIDHWTGSRWEHTASVSAGLNLGGNELWQLAALEATGVGAEVVRMGDGGVVGFRYACRSGG
jgi:hypothetical protein